MLTGAVKDDFSVAVEVEGQPEPVSTLAWLMRKPYHHHFGCLIKNIEKMFETGQPPYPVERTVLTTGMINAAMQSLAADNRRIETPHLDVAYRATQWGHAPGEPNFK